MKDIKDLVILVTGSTDGLGKGTANVLAAMGATILLHGRNKAKLVKTSDEIKKATGNDRIKTYLADYSSLDEVRRLAAEILETNDQLDVAINNAGIGPGRLIAPRRETSKDGYELRFSVNYLAHFLLTNLLVPGLRRGAPSRIVNVASARHVPIDFGNIMLTNHYNGIRAYGQSKTALIMFTFDLAERLKKDHITVNCLHPTSLMNTKLVRRSIGIPFHSVQTGVNAVIYLATSSELDDVTGRYFNQKQESRAIQQAYDLKARNELLELSEKLTGVKLPL
jgi:NAD(P)-dependent dehydrogenase (short-subunit alcohol dehydrogenase family)